MRIEVPREAERLGATLFYGVQRVYELDAGIVRAPAGALDQVIAPVAFEAIEAVCGAMAVIVPVRGERIKLLEGVLAGIPHACLVIVVSNSEREPIDRFPLELNAVLRYRRFTGKRIVVVHQKDRAVGEGVAQGGLPELVGDDGRVKDGKAEGMAVATLLAALAGKRYIGFVDADNYFPGAVHEYVREFAAGLLARRSDYAMVRINWHSKPKIVRDALFFAKLGRATVVTNRFLNALIGYYTGFETEVIRTGNAGEHAMTMDLALKLGYASGYATETRHFLDLLELFGSILENPARDVLDQYVEVFQIESRNPHLHDIAKGEAHIGEMMLASLGVIHASPLCPRELREEIVLELRRRRLLARDAEPPAPVLYPPLERLRLESFAEAVANEPFAGALLG
ncbi:MAG TPA: mannosyl-3-phosphoglycerate synthase [Trueperaceae bacterium]|nr:mannosyl-3-phosphoglycerate synthase [Trueperaceae bacterium]